MIAHMCYYILDFISYTSVISFKKIFLTIFVGLKKIVKSALKINYFFSTKTYVMGTKKNRLNEMRWFFSTLKTYV